MYMYIPFQCVFVEKQIYGFDETSKDVTGSLQKLGFKDAHGDDIEVKKHGPVSIIK